MIPIRFIIRICTLTLFNFKGDIFCIILLVLLSLPFFLNLIRKYLAAQLTIFDASSRRLRLDKDQHHAA